MHPLRRATSATRWAGRGVPRLYHTAREAGLSRREALQAVAGSGHALALARWRHGRRHRLENAVRHFVWQAWLTATYGRPVAGALGAAHEGLASTSMAGRADSAVDAANNLIGQTYGERHARRLRALGMLAAQRTLATEAEQLWAAGQLRAATRASGGGGVRSRR